MRYIREYVEIIIISFFIKLIGMYNCQMFPIIFVIKRATYTY